MPQDRARSNQPGGGDPSSGEGSNADGRAGTYFLGRYRVVDEIGIGGMASVHLARMDGPGGFQKWVAIKRIHPHLVEDQTFIHMFLDEARIAARISHANVATVFDLGEHEDTYWIAMEYLHGEPLREVMRRTEELGAPMPPEIACRVIADAAEGLHAAHELLGKNGEKLGLVHRDVTPHNLFVTYDGTTKVVDFGIAKFSSRMSSTRAGTLKGKLAYMSPEQVHGETIDRRTDLFALGVVLWELTTGQRLFRMESDLDTLAKVQECNVPRPSTIVRGYPMDLEKILMKALAKNRGERFKNAREFSRALQQLLMRRGLFIASDEVAGYMQQIFNDRIKKREAHLRWAAEVTQTINLEGMLTRPPEPIGESSIASYGSEVQPSPPTNRLMPVRPAAGAPPLVPRPPNLSHPTAPRPGAAHRPSETVRPPVKQQPAPQAAPSSEDDGPTLRASPKARAAMMAAHGVEELSNLVPEEDDEDNDDTIVTTTRVDGPGYVAGGGKMPTPIPAAGKPASLPPPGARDSVAFAARSVPARFPSVPPLPPVVVQPPMFPPPSAPPPSDERSTAHVDKLLAEALAEQRGGPPPPRAGSSGTFDELHIPPAAPMPRLNQPTMPRLFAPPTPDMKTDTARALRRPPPTWLVAVGAGITTLVTAGIMIAIAASLTHTSAPPEPAAPAAAVRSAKTSVATTTSGPFGAARTAFATAITLPAPSTTAPAPPATGSALNAAAAPAPPPPTPAPAPAPAAADTAPATAPAVTPPVNVPAARPFAPAAPARRPAPAPAARPAPAAATGDQGQLTVICFPACDSVTDNGQSIGASPIFKRSVPVGEHRLRMTSSNPPSTKVVSVIVMAAQTTTVRQPMTP